MKFRRFITVALSVVFFCNSGALSAQAAEQSASRRIALSEADYTLLLDNGFSSRSQIDELNNRDTTDNRQDFVVLVKCDGLTNGGEYFISADVTYDSDAVTYIGADAGPCADSSITTHLGYATSGVVTRTHSCDVDPNGRIMRLKYYRTDLNVTEGDCFQGESISELLLNNIGQSTDIIHNKTSVTRVALGDVDSSGAVDLADYIMLINFVAEQEYNYNNFNSSASDLNYDGFINNTDKEMLLDYICGFTTHVWGDRKSVV